MMIDPFWFSQIPHNLLVFYRIVEQMRRGFNRYSQNGEEESHSENPEENPLFNPLSLGLLNQFPSFSSNGAASQGIIVSLFQIVEQQSRALQAMVGKVESITQKTMQLTQKIKDLKKNKHQERQPLCPEDRKSSAKGETLKGRGDIIESAALVRILFGEEKQYQYRLQLAQRLDLPLYRERNFFLDIELQDLEGNQVRNSNKIPLSLALYSSENPPKFIEKNTAGQKILKGYIEQSLHQGVCRFQKIQIKQVTSHFRNGWVFIVIIPSMTPLGSVPSQDSFIDYTRIEPLVLDKIVVKAKKLKETRKEDSAAGHECQEDGEQEDQAKAEDPIYSEEK